MNKQFASFYRPRRVVLALALAASLSPMRGARAENTEAPKEDRTVAYRLVNVTIPPDSPLRKAENINKPPAIYILLRDRGRQIGKYSTPRLGWEVDFEPVPRNQWQIWDYSAQKIYSIEIWDSNWFGDDLIFSITGIAGRDFKSTIYEKGSVNLPKERLATIRFEPVAPEEGEKK